MNHNGSDSTASLGKPEAGSLVIRPISGVSNERSEAALGDAREETPKIFLLLVGELCRIDKVLLLIPKSLLKRQAVYAMRTVCLCESRSVGGGTDERDASQNESQQMIPNGAADYDQGSSWSLGMNFGVRVVPDTSWCRRLFRTVRTGLADEQSLA